MNTVQRNAALTMIVGKNAVSGWASVMNEGVSETEKLQKILMGAAGASEKMAAIMRSSLVVQLKTLLSTVIELGFKFAEAFTKQGSDGIKDLTDAARALGPVFKVAGVIFSDLLTVFYYLLPLILAYKAHTWGMIAAEKAHLALGLATKFMEIAKAQGILNAVMSANPIGIITISVALLIGYFVKFGVSLNSIVNLIGVASAAMLVFNVAMAANPLGIVIASVALLTAGLIKLYGLLNDPPDQKKKGFITSSARRTLSANEDITPMSGMPDLFPMFGQTKNVLRAPKENSFKAPNENLLKAPNENLLKAQQVRLNGEININNAPAGSTAKSETSGSNNSVKLNMVGAYP